MKSGVGGDLYSVNAAQAHAAAPLGGGGNLNSAYSAMSSVPGVQVERRRSRLDVQRSLRSGPKLLLAPATSTTASRSTAHSTTTTRQPNRAWACKSCRSIPAGVPRRLRRRVPPDSSTKSSSRVRSPDSPRRTWVSAHPLSTTTVKSKSADRRRTATSATMPRFNGTNQAFRFIDSDNGASFMVPGGIYSGAATIGLSPGYTGCTGSTGPTCQGVKPSCAPGVTPGDFINTNGIEQGCWGYYSGSRSEPRNFVTDRENVVNFHSAFLGPVDCATTCSCSGAVRTSTTAVTARSTTRARVISSST